MIGFINISLNKYPVSPITLLICNDYLILQGIAPCLCPLITNHENKNQAISWNVYSDTLYIMYTKSRYRF